MVIKNFLSMLKKSNLFLLFFLIFISACTLRPIKTKPASKKSSVETIRIDADSSDTKKIEAQNPLMPPTADQANVPSGSAESNEATPGEPSPSEPSIGDQPMHLAPSVKKDLPRLGIILGPGAARSFAYVGFLKELEKNKLPVHAIVGIEFGAIAAAAYANKASANEVEWQMNKLRSEDVFSGGIISSNSFMNKPDNMNEFLDKAFGNIKAEDLKIKFACPAFNLKKNTTYLMNTGKLVNLLPYCLPQPPLFTSYKGNIADTFNINLATQHLRRLGANYIIYVNVISDPIPAKYIESKDYDSLENLLWFNIAKEIDQSYKNYTYQLRINLAGYGVYDFSKKRELMLRGSQLTEKVVQQLAEKLGY